jgi:hypothetical protein
MVIRVFSLEETEKRIRAVGGEIPGLSPVKVLIEPWKPRHSRFAGSPRSFNFNFATQPKMKS